MLPTYIVNSEVLLQRFMGDQRAVREILGCFRDSIPGLIETLHGHVSEMDQGAAFATVKKIIRLAFCSCAVTVQECVFQVEHAVIREDMTSAQEIMPLLELFCAEVIEAVNNADNSFFSSNLVDMA